MLNPLAASFRSNRQGAWRVTWLNHFDISTIRVRQDRPESNVSTFFKENNNPWIVFGSCDSWSSRPEFILSIPPTRYWFCNSTPPRRGNLDQQLPPKKNACTKPPTINLRLTKLLRKSQSPSDPPNDRMIAGRVITNPKNLTPWQGHSDAYFRLLLQDLASETQIRYFSCQ